MITTSFFEYLGLANIERIHSQFFAWIFSADCNAITMKQKATLLKAIFNVDCINSELIIETEHKNIDIIIRTKDDIIIIENKLKSSQHSNQLEKYKDYCEVEFKLLKKHYFLLTLVGEASDITWTPLTYSVLYENLIKIELKQNERHTIIVEEYLICLKKLVDTVTEFTKNPKNFDIVFLNGGKKKGEKIIKEEESKEIKEFISFNNLETILQKCYLNNIANKLENKLGFNISETHGVALLNLPIKNEIKFKKINFTTVIQFQGKSIKFAFHAENYKDTKKDFVEDVIPKMKSLLEKKEFNYEKFNQPTSKTFMSLSKNIGDTYWEKSIDEIVELIKIEIKNAKSLTKSLIKLLK